MEEAETLRTIAEVAITIAGFTGVVVVFGARVGGDWTKFEADRLWLLLAQALLVTLLAFLPILLDSARLPDQATWRVSNLIFAITYTALGVPTALGKQVMIHPDGSRAFAWFIRGTVLVSSLIVVAQLAHAIGVLDTRGSFLFLLALLYALAMAGTNFWVLLMGSVHVRH